MIFTVIWILIEFCDSCVVVDPAHSTKWQTSTVYETGCIEKRCVADLNVVLSVSSKYVLQYQHYYC